MGRSQALRSSPIQFAPNKSLQLSPKRPLGTVDAAWQFLAVWVDAAGQLNSMFCGANTVCGRLLSVGCNVGTVKRSVGVASVALAHLVVLTM